MSKATEHQLGDLHGILANHFTDILVNGVPMRERDKDSGEVIEWRRPVTAAELNTIRQFLKDNAIEATADSKVMQGLVASLPEFNDEDAYDNVVALRQ